MGFDQGRIEFDHQDLTYFAGQIVHGRLVFDQEKKKSFRGIYMKMKGECNVHWTTRHSRHVNNRTEHYTKQHNSHEVYFEQKIYLIGGKDGEVTIGPGHYEYPFQCLIPPHCPSSFEGGNGNIHYEFRAVVDRAFKFDQEKCMNITVIAQRDLNMEPYCKEPIEFEFEDSYCCWCMSSGVCEVTALLPQSGYCPGQTISIDLTCSNKSNVEIDFIKFELKEHKKFRATHEPDTRHDTDVIAKLKKGPIPGNTTRNWSLEMDIPQMDVYNVDACQYIDIDHTFEVTVSPSGCHSDTEASRRIVIGHIALREFDDGVPDVEVSQPTAPLAQYPGNQGYPGANPPYQGQTFPPNVNNLPQYPGANPYPGPNAPFTSPVPYPGANQPYPGATSPYPAPNPPYSGHPSPYPGSNPPYPGNQPLPSVSPYPVGNDPIASPGQPGFAIPGGNAPPVMLHPTTNMPYPPNPPTVSSPFAMASAPEPSTPDFNDKNEQPPFNPELQQNEKK